MKTHSLHFPQSYFIILFSLIVLVQSGCKGKDNQGSTQTTPAQKGVILPPLPVQQQSYLYQNVELIDYIFQDLPYSISQTERPSIQAKIAGISQQGVASSNCSPMARMFLQIQGEIMMEADVYFSPPDCHYYIFIENGKEVYANQMGETNIAFYTQFLNRMNATQ